MRISDWSSNVCSSDLIRAVRHQPLTTRQSHVIHRVAAKISDVFNHSAGLVVLLCGFFLAEHQLFRPQSQRDLLPFVTGHAVTDVNRVLQDRRSEEHTSELQSLMRLSYAVFCLKKQK